MSKTPEIFINTGTSAVIPAAEGHTFDPITGHGVVARDYVKQNPIVLEQDRETINDYSLSVYSNVPDALYTQYQNNMVTKVNHRPNLDCVVLQKRIDMPSTKGVFIVERYLLTGINKSVLVDFLEYYKNTKGLPYPEDTAASIKALVSKCRNSRGRFSKAEVRVVSFMPIDTLKDNQFTYVNGPGVVIVHGSVPEELIHPYSPAYLETTLLEPMSETGSLSIDVSIIDSDNKPYYVMVGNKVTTIRPITGKHTSVLPSGCTTKISRGGSVIDDTYFPLEDFETNGFYRSKELCINNGNKALSLEAAKYEIDLEKLVLEVKKLSEANKKLELEAVGREQQAQFDNIKTRDAKDRLLLEANLRTAQTELDIDKINVTREKLILDITAKRECIVLDSLKRHSEHQYAINTREMDMQNTSMKHQLDGLTRLSDLRVSNAKTVMDVAKSQAEIVKAHELHTIKKIDSGVKLVDTILKIVR